MLRGHVDRFRLDGVEGWALDATQPGTPVSITAFVDGKPVATDLTSFKRADVESAFGLRGNFGFRLEFDLDGARGKFIDVRFSKSNVTLENGKRAFRLNADGVVQGQSNWFFEAVHDEIPVFDSLIVPNAEQYVLDAERLHAFVDRDERLRKNGRFLFVVIPDRAVVHSEFLPEGLQVSGVRIATKLRELLPSMLYPLSHVRATRKLLSPYHRCDTHLNDYGVALVFNLISIALWERYQVKLAGLPDFVLRSELQVGDLSHSSLSNAQEEVAVFEYDISHSEVAKNGFTGYGTVRRYRRVGIQGPRILLFGTSSALQFAKVLSFVSPDLLFIFHDDVDYDALRTFEHDIAFLIIQERILWRRPAAGGFRSDFRDVLMLGDQLVTDR